MSSPGPTAPTVQSTMPKHEKPKPIKVEDTAPKAPPPPPPQAPQSGTHPRNNPGSTVYDSRKAGRMIRVSKILTRYQDLTVEEDEPGDSSLLK